MYINILIFIEAHNVYRQTLIDPLMLAVEISLLAHFQLPYARRWSSKGGFRMWYSSY